MSRTRRKRFDGHKIRDGEWGRRCPDPQCNMCGTGNYKGENNRLERRRQQDAVEYELREGR